MLHKSVGLTFAEAMDAGCTVIAAEHPDSAAYEVIANAGFLTEATAPVLSDTLRETLEGARPDQAPTERAQQYDWDTVTDQAERAFQRAINGAW